MAARKERYTIVLHDTDAAGIIFFANQFRFVHDVYERFMTEIGYDFRSRLDKRDFLVPIIHAESDYTRPLRVGDTIDITLNIARIGRSSFTLEYLLTTPDGKPAGMVTTVHVTIDATSHKKIDLPDNLRFALESAAEKNA